jgi:hypothetical protein
MIQMICQWAVLDGLQHPQVKRLAELGSSGKSPQHCNDQLTLTSESSHLLLEANFSWMTYPG